MKSLGKGIVEFKKGIKGVEDEVEDTVSKQPDKLEATDKKHDKIEMDDKKNIEEMKG
jgi:sec-independent protein translocase protein TatA